MARAVLVLQPFAGERRAAGGRAEQKAARARVRRRPDEIADALEAEHRVEDVERQHRHAVRAVAGRGRDPRGHRAGLGDAFLEDLAVLRLLVVEQLVAVLGLVELADRRVDRRPAGTATACRTCALRRRRSARCACRCSGRAGAATAAARTPSWSIARARCEPSRMRANASSAGTGELRRVRDARRHVAAERLAPRVQVAHLRRSVGRAGRSASSCTSSSDSGSAKRSRNACSASSSSFFCLVRAHPALAPVAHAVALLGLREDDRRLAAVRRPRRDTRRRS